MPPDFLLDRASRDAAIDNLGDLSRAEALLSRLKQGEPVTLAAVGGSITAGHGAWGPAKNSGWSRVLFDALEQRWPARPGSQHTYANGAIPAVPPPYFLACLHDCIPAPVDMLLIELAANSDATRRNHIGAIEALIRRALTWPGAPLVLLIDWTDHWGWPISNGRYNRTAAAGSAAGSDRHFSRASRQASSRAARGPFFAPKPHSDWDYYAVSAPRINRHLSSYYRVPHLSTSAALWHHDRSDTIGLRHEEIAADWNHPNTKGHAIMAELVMHYLLLAERQAKGSAHALSQPPPRPPPPLPPPLDAAYVLPDGETYTCLSAERLRAAVVSYRGFAYVTADPDDPRRRHKPGLLSTSVGDSVALAVGSAHSEIVLGYLVSYAKQMGHATASCINGCLCDEIKLDGRHIDPTSVMAHAALTLTEPHENCTVVLRHSTAHGGAALVPKSEIGKTGSAIPEGRRGALSAAHARASSQRPQPSAAAAGAPSSSGASKFKLLSVLVAPPGQSMNGGLVWGEAAAKVIDESAGKLHRRDMAAAAG